MNKIYKKARAKINLTLNILDKRPDGYHNLESVFQSISLYDELFIEKTNTNKLEIVCNIKGLESKNNLIFQTYNFLKERHSNIYGIKVILKKNIPMERGLAGGSTDCASFLICMNKLFKLDYSESDLINIGKAFGADVAPCLNSGNIFARGIGEIITKINSNIKYYIVVVSPDFSCNTGLMYEKLDKINNKTDNSFSNDVINALENNNLKLLCDNLYNDFEKVLKNNSKIFIIKNLLIENSAVATLLSGSGSSVFGIFDSKEKSKLAYRKLKKTYETFWCLNRGGN